MTIDAIRAIIDERSIVYDYHIGAELETIRHSSKFQLRRAAAAARDAVEYLLYLPLSRVWRQDGTPERADIRAGGRATRRADGRTAGAATACGTPQGRRQGPPRTSPQTAPRRSLQVQRQPMRRRLSSLSSRFAFGRRRACARGQPRAVARPAGRWAWVGAASGTDCLSRVPSAHRPPPVRLCERRPVRPVDAERAFDARLAER